MQYIYKYQSPIGGITIASDGSSLTGLWFDGQKYFAASLSPEHEEKVLPVFDVLFNLFTILLTHSHRQDRSRNSTEEFLMIHPIPVVPLFHSHVFSLVYEARGLLIH